MTMQDFVNILVAIRDNKEVKVPYQLIKHGELNNIINALGQSGAVDYFGKILEAEPATFT